MKLFNVRPVSPSVPKLVPPHRFAAVFAMLAILIVGNAGVSSAQDADDEAPAHPVVTVCVASVDRIMDNVNYVFGEIERPEVMDLIGAGLANFRDLEGLDRTKPGGLMIFVSEGLIPLPIPVGFLPVSDIGELGQTFTTLGAQLKPIPGEEDRYELIPRRGPTSFLVMQGDYAFIGQNEESINRTFALPEEFAGPLANRYDVCASANLRKTPKAVRDLILMTIKNSAQASMQRRDDEPEAVYNLRRSQAEGNLHFVENVLRDGEELTLGFKVDREAKNASLELVVKATPNSSFAKELKEGIAKPSFFAPAIDENIPFSGSVSVMLDKPGRKTLLDAFNLGEQESNRGLAGLDQDVAVEDIPGQQATQDLFGALRETIKEGHLDGFIQFFGEPGEKFVIVGGVKLMNSSAFGSGLSDVLEQASRTDANMDVELGVDSYGDIVFHKLSSKKRDAGDKRMFGAESALYFGTDNQALWFCVGGDAAIPTLRTAIDRIAAGTDAGPRRGELAPFQVIINLTEWININQQERTKPGRFAALALEAFEADGSDIIRADARSLKNGFRFRVQVENGFLRLLGMAIARRIDGSQDL